MQKNREKENLKTGFTTGSCAAVTAKAAWMQLAGKQVDYKIDLLFPDGKFRTMKLKSCELRKSSGYASIIKDAGDDPDITDKAVICSEVSRIQGNAVSTKDHVFECGKAKIAIRGGEGVGIVTKPGIEVSVGKYAINPVPQQMIIKNLQDSGCGESEEIILVVVSIENGKKLAEKTLNPSLGIKDGLSILGTTGIVEPKSHSAYIKTIEILLKGLSIEGCDTAVLCTGARTLEAAKIDFPEIPDFAFIRIGDFIAESLKKASDLEFNKIVISCMPGKLFKYSSGYEYTHAHKNKLDIKAIYPILVENNIPDAIINKALENVTFRGLLESLDYKLSQKIINAIGEKAITEITKWAEEEHCEIRCYGYNKNLIGTWKNE